MFNDFSDICILIAVEFLWINPRSAAMF